MDIKKQITSHGYTISSVAGMLGISQSALSQQINNGTITFAKVEQIASLCGLSLAQFLGFSESEVVNSELKCPHCGKLIKIGLTIDK